MRLFLLLFIFPFLTNAQNPDYVKSVIDQLCSEDLHGRGYVNNGCEKAADYILKEIGRVQGISAFPGGYTREFYFPVNTFPGEVTLRIDDNPLSNDGTSFLVDPACPVFEGTYKVMRLDSADIDRESYKSLKKKKIRNYFLLLDPAALKNINNKEGLHWLRENGPGFRGIIEISDRLIWSVSQSVAAFPKVYILRRPDILFIHEISLRVESDYNRGFTARNIAAYIKGRKYPDSFIVFTAHYDHLGQMGRNAIFPGANDNAGGVAMLLDLLRYYENHPPEYSVACIFFAGEEAGLVGSMNYCRGPMFPLNKIKFLLNLDLVTTGAEGMMVVNATAHPEYFEALNQINKNDSLLKTVSWRHNAPNSDHYPFTILKVPAFFLYLMGPYPWYHEPEDASNHINLSHYPNAFALIRKFADTLMQSKK